ncbi:hypothetical protein CMO92_01770, partial [Candidatus Woesearchaeota archaeon]|nr:hypothetical protein [Candidatus Woesearchaeota archaeon]
LSRGGKAIDAVVLHWTADRSRETTLQTLRERGLSYHYIIERDGSVTQHVKESEAAQHAGGCGSGKCTITGMNARSIGISLVNLGSDCVKGGVCDLECGDEEKGKLIESTCYQTFTETQIDSLVKLVADIGERNEISLSGDTLFSHTDVKSEKPDPGPLLDLDDIEQRARASMGDGGEEIVPDEDLPPQLEGVCDPELGQPHNYKGGVEWKLTAQGIATKQGGSFSLEPASSSDCVVKVTEEYGTVLQAASEAYGVPMLILAANLCTEDVNLNPESNRCEDSLESKFKPGKHPCHPFGCELPLYCIPDDYGGSSCKPEQDGSRTKEFAGTSCSYGMAHLLYTTAWGLGFRGAPDELYDEQKSIELMAKLISEKSGSHNFDPPKVAAVYNAGSLRKTDKNKWHMVSTGDHISRWVGHYNRGVSRGMDPCAGGYGEIKSFGSYSFTPSASAAIENDLDQFDKMVAFMKGVVEECDDKTEYCLNQKIAEFNEENERNLSRDCGESLLFYEYVEKYTDCTENAQVNCFCQIELDPSQEEETTKLKHWAKGALELEKPELGVSGYPLSEAQEGILTKEELEETSKEYEYVTINVEYDDGDLKKRMLHLAEWGGDKEWEPYDTINLFKEEGGVVYVKEYKDDAGYELKCEDNLCYDTGNYQLCKKPKRKYSLCYDTGETELVQTGSDFSEVSLELKFSVWLEDIQPPEDPLYLSSSVLTLDFSEFTPLPPPANKVIQLQWKDMATDVFEYRIIGHYAPFLGMDETTIQGMGAVAVFKKKQYREARASIGHMMCSPLNLPDLLGKFDFDCVMTADGMQEPAYLDTLYFDESVSTYYYLTEVPSTYENYYFSVNGIDDYDNQITPFLFESGKTYLEVDLKLI